jgi:hypothetical protein
MNIFVWLISAKELNNHTREIDGLPIDAALKTLNDLRGG